MIAKGRSPAIEKQRDRRQIEDASRFDEFGEKWLTNATMADEASSRRMGCLTQR